MQSAPSAERVRSMIIVARDQPELFQALARQFAGDPTVHVFQDRRQWGRRQRIRADSFDRRWADRRLPPSPEQDILRRSFVIVRKRNDTLRG